MTATTLPSPPFSIQESIKNEFDPEYVAFFEKYLSNNPSMLYTHLVPLDQIRAGGNVIPGQAPLLDVAKTYDIKIPRDVTTAETSVPSRVFIPTGEAPESGWPVTLWFHGGGWVLGNIDTENSMCTRIAEWSRCIVISVDYRLAPEHPFPAAIEDSWEALLWTFKNAKEMNIDTKKVAVAGSSAGGNIAAILSHKFAASGLEYPPLVFQLLIVPVCDNTADVETHESWKTLEHTPQLPREKMMWYRYHYLPNKEDWNNPEASPIFYSDDSFSKVCPALICAAGLDVLRTEAEVYGEKLEKNGVKVETKIYPGVPHPVMAMNAVLTQGDILVKDSCKALKAAFD